MFQILIAQAVSEIFVFNSWPKFGPLNSVPKQTNKQTNIKNHSELTAFVLIC